MTRTVTKLLQDTYAAHDSAGGEVYIRPTLLDVWEKSGSGEAVAAEAFVALELAAREVMKTERITYSRLEDIQKEEDGPDMIKPLFEAAIIRTQSPKAVTP